MSLAAESMGLGSSCLARQRSARQAEATPGRTSRRVASARQDEKGVPWFWKILYDPIIAKTVCLNAKLFISKNIQYVILGRLFWNITPWMWADPNLQRFLRHTTKDVLMVQILNRTTQCINKYCRFVYHMKWSCFSNWSYIKLNLSYVFNFTWRDDADNHVTDRRISNYSKQFLRWQKYFHPNLITCLKGVQMYVCWYFFLYN